MIWKLIFTALIAFGVSDLSGQGYRIEVDVKGYTNDTLLLGYYYWNNQFIQDSAFRNPEGKFVFEGKDTLDAGMYMLVTKPKNDFAQLVIPKDDQVFELKTHVSNLADSMTVNGSQSNMQFIQYIQFLGLARKTAERNQASFKEDPEGLKNAMNLLDERVKSYQDSIVENFPKGMLTFIITANREVQIPEFTGGKKEVRNLQYEYYVKHYFDLYNLSDPRWIHSSFLHGKIDHYLKKVIVQIPDTINKSLDVILKKLEGNEESYKRVLGHYLNEYAASEYVGMDAVYVHLVENYYAGGKAPWVKEEQLAKMVDDAKKLKPLLIGKPAPDMTLNQRDGTKFTLYDLKSKYTILLFWASDCGHCKKTMPKLKEIYPEMKSRGAELVSVCTQLLEKEKDCWKYLDENDLEGTWINATDKYLRSRFKQNYNITSTPQIYILDADKKIMSKKIGLENVVKILDTLEEIQNKS